MKQFTLILALLLGATSFVDAQNRTYPQRGYPSVRAAAPPATPPVVQPPTPTQPPSPTIDATWIALQGDLVVSADAVISAVRSEATGEFVVMAVPSSGKIRYFTVRIAESKDKPTKPPLTPPTTDPTTPPDPVVDPTRKVTAAVYVYEKDDSAVPTAVLSAINKLNRENKILATLFEDDTTNGGGRTPAQYEVALAAAKREGLPALVIQSKGEVLRVVKDPRTEQAVLDAAK
jgi:hypothetical protein